ncbi:hypothetical protein LCGC14_3089140 [marine sediment metagenome]|uniref:Uncharacterized protein n=1 Tax=marine sediment metagenome TaxID=412755 RepID=A0A0F8Z1K0_9ZZZZ
MKELKKGCVVFMKAESGCVGYGNAQCVEEVHCVELGTISLYGHNQHYTTSDIDRVVSYPVGLTKPELLAASKLGLLAFSAAAKAMKKAGISDEDSDRMDEEVKATIEAAIAKATN